MAHYLVTGAAGFIGSRTSEMLVQDGHTVIGIDNMNDAYDVRMKQHRLARLEKLPGFRYQKIDISSDSGCQKAERREIRCRDSSGGACRRPG